MCSTPALPKSWAAGGDWVKPRSSMSRPMCLSTGIVRSVHLAWSDPRSIFSKPRAMTQSEMPPSMNCFAM